MFLKKTKLNSIHFTIFSRFCGIKFFWSFQNVFIGINIKFYMSLETENPEFYGQIQESLKQNNNVCNSRVKPMLYDAIEIVKTVPRLFGFALGYWFNSFGDSLVRGVGGLEQEDLEDL